MSLPSYCYEDDERDAKDAARYRWLRERAPQTLAGIAYGASKAAHAIQSSDPDAAIDAAMGSQDRMCPARFDFCQRGCPKGECEEVRVPLTRGKT